MLTILRNLMDYIKSTNEERRAKEFDKKFDQYMDELYKEAKKNERYKKR